MKSPRAILRCSSRALLLAVALLFAVATIACDGTSEGVNSNTNWLLACERTEDCEGHWDCLCGVCTVTCEDSCEAEAGQCIAADALAHALQCDGEPQAALCLRGCDDVERPCGADEICVNGACTARPDQDDCEARSDALFCSGFDAADLDAATLIDGGELSQSVAQKLAGEGSLAAAVRDDNQRSRARYDIEPQTEGTLYLRAWMYLDLEDASRAHVHTISIGSVDTPMHGTNVHILDGKLGLTFQRTGDIAGRVAVPARTWFCVRLEIALDAENGSSRIWLNDELSAETDGADTLPPDGVHNLALGIDHTVQPDTRLLLDDVVLATSPAACAD